MLYFLKHYSKKGERILANYSDILLTTDFDRTLTAPDSSIPSCNLEAIRYFMEQGGIFTVNTGRTIPSSTALMEIVPVNAPFLLYNGSAAYDKSKDEFLFFISCKIFCFSIKTILNNFTYS